LPEFQAFILTAVVEIEFLLEHQAFCRFLREKFASS
jgi:hypothetical protein